MSNNVHVVLADIIKSWPSKAGNKGELKRDIMPHESEQYT